MTFGKILRFPLGLLDRLNPLAPGAHWMLRNAPTFWRASFLKIVWYLLLAHVGLSIFGILSARNITSIPTHGELMVFRYWIWPLAGILAAGWIASIWRTPLIDRRLRQKITSIAIYTGFFYGLMTLPNAYFTPVSGAIAKLYEQDFLESDRRALSQGFSEICGLIDPKDQGLDATTLRLHVGRVDRVHARAIVLILKKNRVESLECEGNINSYHRFSIGEFDNLEHMVQSGFERGYFNIYDFPLRLQNDGKLVPAIMGFSLETRFLAAEASLEFSDQRGALRALHGLFRPLAFIVATLAALVLFWLEDHRHLIGNMIARTDVALRKGALSFLSAPYRAIDRRLLRRRPQLWQARLHVAVPLALAVLLFGSFGAEISEWFMDTVSARLGDLGTNENVEIAIGVSYVVVLVLTGVLLMRSQARFMAMNRSIPGAGVRAFLALFLPVFLAVTILFLIGVYTDNDELTISGFFGGALVYFIAVGCWGVCFVGLIQTLKSLGIVFAFATGTIMILVTTNAGNTTIGAVLAPMTIVVLLAVARWPRGFFDRFSSQGICLVFLFFAGFTPFVTAGCFDILISNLDQMVPNTIAAMGFAPLIVLILPTLKKVQRHWIEPEGR